MMAAFNARAETIETKSFYFDAEGTRCLIPVSGYREWQDGSIDNTRE